MLKSYSLYRFLKTGFRKVNTALFFETSFRKLNQNSENVTCFQKQSSKTLVSKTKVGVTVCWLNFKTMHVSIFQKGWKRSRVAYLNAVYFR